MIENLLIHRSADKAAEIKKVFLLGGDWHTCGYFSALTGRRFDRIILYGSSVLTDAELEKFHDWFDTAVKTKLPPNGGEIIYL